MKRLCIALFILLSACAPVDLSRTRTPTSPPRSRTPTVLSRTATPQASPGIPTPVGSPGPTSIPPTQGPPGTNQLLNPCLDGVHSFPVDPPWQATSGWDVSKYKNPCGPNGTAARINDPIANGESGPNRDERIWQVVPSQGQYLLAEIACVNHHDTVFADLNIYGGPSPSGPWTLVWVPFTKATCALDRWGPVQHAEVGLAQVYAWYKFELAAMYAVDGGVKFTSALFWSGDQ